MIGGWPGWVVAALAAWLSSVAAARLASGAVEVSGVTLGWAVAVINNAAALFLNLRAVRSDHASFYVYGLLGNGVRFLTIVGIIGIILLVGGGSEVSFATALVISYLILVVYEIRALYVVGLTAACKGKSADSLKRGSDGHK